MDATSPAGNQWRSSAISGRSTGNSAVSYFKKTVTLQDWWLIKADQDCEGKSLGVAGYPPSGQRGWREFHSAPIKEIHGAFHLETVDGVTVLISGSTNQIRSLQNGFPLEVSKYFVMGFPPYWEQCTKRWVEDAYNNETHTMKISADPDVQFTAAVSTPTSDKDKSDVKVMNDGPYPRLMKFGIKALKSCILQSPILRSRSSAFEKVNTKKHSSVEGTCDTVYHDASRSSPERIDKLGSNKRSKERSVQNLNSKDPVLVNSTSNSSSAPEEDSGFESSDVDHLNVLELNLRKPSKSYDSPRYGYALRSGVISRSTASVPQVPEPMSGFYSEKESDTSASPDAGKFGDPEFDSNNVKCTVTESLVQSHTAVILGVPAVAESIGMYVNPNIDEPVHLKQQGNSSSKGWKPRSKLLRAKYPREKKASGSAVEQNKELPSESVKPHLAEEGKNGAVHKRTLPASAKAKTCKSEVGASRRKRNSTRKDRHEKLNVKDGDSSGTTKVKTSKSEVGASRRTRNSTRKERHEKLNVKDGDSSRTTKVKRRICFEPLVTPDTVKGKSRSSLHSPESLDRSRSVKGESRSCLQSPESLNLKRSRSGRLLLPPLDFWRNQIPVYDNARNVTGILEGLDTVQPSRGSRSEQPRKRKRKMV